MNDRTVMLAAWTAAVIAFHIPLAFIDPATRGLRSQETPDLATRDVGRPFRLDAVPAGLVGNIPGPRARTYYEALMKNLPLNGAIMGGWLWSALAERWRARRQEALSDYPGVGSPGDRSTDVRLGNHR